MPAPTVTVQIPGPNNYSDPGILRPQTRIAWTGGTGPFDVLHEWDTDINFGSPITDSNTGVTSPDVGVPPSDMGPAGTTWYYRATVTDTFDSASTTSGVEQLDWFDADLQRRYLYLLTNVGVGFDPTDAPAGGWGTGGTVGPDGDPIDFRRYLYLLTVIGVGFDPIDDPAPDGSWTTGDPPDGYQIDFRRYLYLLTNIGVGFDPTDTPAGGWDPSGTTGADAGDGYTIDFNRYHYLLANIDDTTPTPHIWYLFPTFGREGWEFQIIGYGFGDTQATYSGSVTLNGLAAGVISWELVAETDPNLGIDPQSNLAEPIHQLIRAAVPEGASSGLVIVCTDGP